MKNKKKISTSKWHLKDKLYGKYFPLCIQGVVHRNTGLVLTKKHSGTLKKRLSSYFCNLFLIWILNLNTENSFYANREKNITGTLQYNIHIVDHIFWFLKMIWEFRK